MSRLQGVFLSLLLASGCAAYEQGFGETPGWERFTEFSAVLEQAPGSYTPSAFHSMSILDELATLNDEERHQALVSREFPRYFSEIDSHFEETVEGRVCLVVNGVMSHGDHASLLLALVPEEGQLKFDEVLLYYVDDPSEWLTSAECPQVFVEGLKQNRL